MTTTEPTTEDTAADDEAREPGPGQMSFGAEDSTDHDTEDNDAGTIAVLPPVQDPHMGALVTLREHVGAMQAAKLFAEGMCYTDLVPARFRGKPGDGAAAILYGAEVGLSPIASLRSVIVIHGMPGFEARTMKALLKSHGYKFRTIEKSPTRAAIECTSPDGSETEFAEWTIEDAIAAEYVPTKDEKTGKWRTNDRGKLIGNMKYITTPKVMLDAKATAEVCRSIAPHILLGMPYAAEELEDWDDDADDVTAERVDDRPRRAGGVDKLRERAAKAHHPADDHLDVEEVAVPDEAETAAPDPQPADTSPPPPDPDPTPVDDADEAQQPTGDSGTDRPKAMRTMHALFREAGLGGDDNRDDRLAVIAEIIASPKSGLGQEWRKVASSNDLTDQELKVVVDALTAAKPDKRGGLKWYVGEAINAASLREAGLT